MEQQPPDMQPGSVILDRYRVERLLGEGGMGIVALAFDTRLKRLVAIKTIKREPSSPGDESDRFQLLEARFAREAEAGSRVGSHPNLVTVYDLVVDPRRTQYLILEYVSAGSLGERVARGPLPLVAAQTIAVDVAAGLLAAHSHGVVHRDVKPSNIFLTDDGHAKLGDFSIAQIDDLSRRTQTTPGHPGTPLYMSPEQARSTGYVRPSSDQYSLGLVLFEMLTGAAYKRLESYEVNALLARQPAAVAAVVARMLAAEPGERYPGMSAALAALRSMTTTSELDAADSVTVSDVDQTMTELAAPTPRIGPAAIGRSGGHERTARLSRRTLVAGLGTLALAGMTGGAVLATRLIGTGAATPTATATASATTGIGASTPGPTATAGVPGAATTATGSPAVAPPPAASVPASPHLWYYMHRDDGTLMLHGVAPDGTQVAPVPLGQKLYASDIADDGSAAVFLDAGSAPMDAIVVGRPDGSDRALILHTNSLVDNITIAPQGSHVAFWLQNQPSSTGTPQSVLYLARRDGTGLTQVAHQPTTLDTAEQTETYGIVSWAPDGSQIAFWLTEQIDEVHLEDSLYVAGVLAAPEPRLIMKQVRQPNTSLFAAAFAHDGTRLAFWYPEASNALGLNVADTTGANLRTLVRVFANGLQPPPSWSPDGQWLAFVGVVRSGQELYLVDSGSGTLRALTTGEAADACFGWSPDGTALYFSSYLPTGRNDAEIFAIGVDDDGPRQLTANAEDQRGNPANVRVSLDNRYLSYQQFRTGKLVDLHLLDLQTGDDRVVASTPSGIDAWLSPPAL